MNVQYDGGWAPLWTVCALAVFLCLFGAPFLHTLWRTHTLRKTAFRNGWEWNDDELPPDLPVRDLIGEYDQPLDISNAITGKQGEISFVAFDCKVSGRKRSDTFSIVAACSEENPFSAERFTRDFIALSDGSWFVLMRSLNDFAPAGYRLLRVAEVVSLICSIG